MKRSTDRILTTHIGSLVRPPELVELMRAQDSGQAYDPAALAARVQSAVRHVVHRQVEVGVDVPSDGEYGKPSFSGYVNPRLSGFERRPRNPHESPLLNWGRDRQLFREFYEAYDRATGSASGSPVVCTGPIAYQGQAAVQSDIANFKAALAGLSPEEAFIPAVAPGTIELQRRNEYYPTDEAYLFAIAEAMRQEYRAIVDGSPSWSSCGRSIGRWASSWNSVSPRSVRPESASSMACWRVCRMAGDHEPGAALKRRTQGHQRIENAPGRPGAA